MYSGYRGISCVVGRTISIISALGSGHNQTTIEPITKNKDVTREPLQLGHFDDQHYVSLRKKNWSDVWFESKKLIGHIFLLFVVKILSIGKLSMNG